jgi:hypothetical protein
MIGYQKDSQLKSKRVKVKKVKNERKHLIKELDDLVREILFKTEDSCITCGLKLGRFHPIDNPHGLQVGHYKSRSIYPLRWDLNNCHLQCARENYIHENDSLPYTLALIKLGGVELLEYLERIHLEYRITNKTMTTVRLREIKEDLTKLLIDTE